MGMINQARNGNLKVVHFRGYKGRQGEGRRDGLGVPPDRAGREGTVSLMTMKGEDTKNRASERGAREDPGGGNGHCVLEAAGAVEAADSEEAGHIARHGEEVPR